MLKCALLRPVQPAVFALVVAATSLGACRAATRSTTPGTAERTMPALRTSRSEAPGSAAAATAEPPTEPEEPSGSVDLSAALAAALARRPELGAADHELAALAAEGRLARRGANASVSLDVENFGGEGALGGFDEAETTLWVGRPLELGGRREARARVADAALSRAESELAVARAEVVAQTTTAFYRALAAQEGLVLARAAEETARELRSAVGERVSAGKVSPIEETRSQVLLTGAGLARRSAELEWEAARRDLAATWDGEPGFDSVVGDLGAVGEPPRLDDLERALAASPRLRVWDDERERRRAARAAARAESRADLDVRAGVRRFESADDLAAVVSLDLHLPWPNRGTDLVRAADARLRAVELERGAAALDLERELAGAWSRLVAAWEEVRTVEASLLPDAAGVLAAVDEGYREGKFGLLDVLDAQRTHVDARLRRVDALVAYHLARARIEALIGGPLP